MMLKEYWVQCGEIRVRKLRWQFSFRNLLLVIALAAGVCAAAREIHWEVHLENDRRGNASGHSLHDRRAVLTAACRWWARWKQLDDLAAAEPTAANVRSAATCWKEFDRIATHYGLTPTARMRLKSDAPPPVAEDDPFDMLMKMRESAG